MLGVFALTEIFYTTHIQDGIKLIHVPTRTTESEMGSFRGHMGLRQRPFEPLLIHTRLQKVFVWYHYFLFCQTCMVYLFDYSTSVSAIFYFFSVALI